MNQENLVFENSNTWKKNKILIILGVISLAIIIRLHYFSPEIPITMDGMYYFRYAIDVTVLGHFPEWHLTNNGWPLFLSLFFSLVESEDFLVYMSIQKLLAIIMSSLTAIPVYHLCKKFFDSRFAIIGSALFVFQPYVIENSIAGLTEPIFIFLTTSSLALIFSNNKKMIYFAFAIGALATMIRWEGITLFLAISTLYFWRFRNLKRSIPEYVILVMIFILILTPVLIMRMEILGTETITTSVISGSSAFSDEAMSVNNDMSSPIFYLSEGLFQLIKLLGLVSIPIFLILIPSGVYFLFKNKISEKYKILVPIFILSITAFYAYSRGIEEVRYLLVLFPLFSIISLYPIQSIFKKISNGKIVLIAVFLIVIFTSVLFLEIRKVDERHEI